MATVNLVNNPESIITGNDNIVIREFLEGIRGGKSLDTTGFTPTVIKGGHMIIIETATGEYKPMPVTGNAYAALPGGHTYAGVLVASILKDKPLAAILVRGTVNPKCTPYAMDTILAAVKTAMPLISWRED